MNEPLLEVDDLTIRYQMPDGDVTAVADASFQIDTGEYFGLVGESGCGKSTIAKAIIGGLDENGYVESGKIVYDGQEIQDFGDSEYNQAIRWKEISLVPQGSMNSLDPLQRIKAQAIELAQVHTDMTKQEATERLRELFGIVGIDTNRINDHPHQFSGGMQQRAIIALALLLEPKLIIADEPTTALDVIMQDQVFQYLNELREDNVSLLLITHDISLIFEACDQLAIMHAGQVAETGPITDLYDNPHHPYSILLQEAFPDIREPNRDLETIEGFPPEMKGPVETCTFADRCPWAEPACRESAPQLEPIRGAGPGHLAACFRKDEIPDLYEADRSEGHSASEQPHPGPAGGEQ